MADRRHPYRDRLTSRRTSLLFIALLALFTGLLSLRLARHGMDGWAWFFFAGAAFFLFYTLNFNVLELSIDEPRLDLRFGIFRWGVALEQVAAVYMDPSSLWRIGGAGIHFSFFGGMYRAMFNFLEYPRVVLRLKYRRGPVQEIAFSTREPHAVLARLAAAGVAIGRSAAGEA